MNAKNMLFSLAFFLLVGQISTESLLSQALNDPNKLLGIYSNYRDKFPRHFAPNSNNEWKQRLRMFRNSIRFAEKQNRRALGWKSGINLFSDMTQDEVKLYEGINSTGLATPHPSPTPSIGGVGHYQYPDQTNWLQSVFEPENQGNCGSCWIFGSISSLEGRYHKLTGKLKRFSQQHMLDCVFAWRADDGCAGGANWCTYRHIEDGGPIIRQKDYPAYSAKAGSCIESKYPDAQKAAKYVRWVKAHESEEGLLVALSSGVVAVSFFTTPAFRAYDSGIIRDESCMSVRTSHAVAAVGYTKRYVLVKNSWGTKWGERGFVKFGRNHHGCLIMKYGMYPVFELTGRTDSDPSDSPTTFNPFDDNGPTEAPKPIPTCEDKYPAWFCSKSRCTSSVENAVNCMKTCNRCSFDKNSCPRGRTMCSDATCKTSC